jgi:hypothetical protein
LVEKRTLVFVTLATVVLTVLASTFAGYYYLQYTNNAGQLTNTQNSLNTIASNYTESANKYYLLLNEYLAINSTYSSSKNSSYVTVMPPLGNLITSFGGNYTDLLAQKDINETYNHLLNDYEKLLQNGTVTREDYGSLLSEYYNLFNLSALKEIGLSINKATTLSVNVTINYENGTVTWYNATRVPAGYTLFDLTQKIAIVKYSYSALIEPGHVFVDSINNKAAYTDPSYTWGYGWIWYYWNDAEKNWVSGPVGCDAWLLKDGGIYKWNYERW